MLIRLIFGAGRVIDERRSGLLDVVTQHVRNRPRRRKLRQGVDAGLESGKIAHVKPPGINRIARQEALIERLRESRSALLDDALQLLASMQDLLETMRAHVARL